jgi:hypothetical protein
MSDIQLNDPQPFYRRWEDSQWSPFDVDLSTEAARSRRLNASYARWTRPTFSRDIARSVSPPQSVIASHSVTRIGGDRMLLPERQPSQEKSGSYRLALPPLEVPVPT